MHVAIDAFALVAHISSLCMLLASSFLHTQFLGNPVGLASELGSATADFFVEPAKGLMLGPEQFGAGLAKGSSALLRGTIGGLMSAAGAITNSASKAMAAASGDAAFAASQGAAMNQKQPEHIGSGLRMGVVAFGSSLVSGVTGIILDPLAGARKEGLVGFGKGLARGLAGVIFKLKGIGNTAGYLLDGRARALTTVRPKRYIDPATGVITPFDREVSEAHHMH
jgi:vacuolar protein sorting-associated protein 13A/C